MTFSLDDVVICLTLADILRWVKNGVVTLCSLETSLASSRNVILVPIIGHFYARDVKRLL